MKQGGRRTTFAERLEISERWQAGERDPEMAQAMGLSVWPVRKWRRRFQREGRAGLVSVLGRPATGALGQFPLKMRDWIRDQRREHTGWGALTRLIELRRTPEFATLQLPSRARIAAFLRQEGFPRGYERHQDLPKLEISGAPTTAHTEWEMDAQGVIQVVDLGRVSVINIVDVASRLKVVSWACLHTSHPRTADYQVVLGRAFGRYGLPARISVDHDSVFYDQTSKSPFPPPLHLWLLALGVPLRFIKYAPPVEHSIVERMHQTITQQAMAGQTFATLDELQHQLAERIDFLNQHLPCRSLDNQPPLVAHPEAADPVRPYRLEWEADLLDLERVYRYLARGRWFRQVSSQGQFSLANHKHGVGQAFAHQTLEMTFDSETHELICLSVDGQRERRLSIKALTQADLMGQLNPLISLPFHQLSLPLSLATRSEMATANELTGTTL